MVLSRRADRSEAGFSKNMFDGSAEKDVGKFFFVYENVTMRGKTEEEKAAELLCYLEGDAFNFYYDTFAKDGVLVDAAKEYSTVKSALVEHFALPEEPEDNIRRAISAHLESRNLVGSLKEMDRCYEKAGFNDEAKFGLLRNAVMQYGDLAQFAIYRGAVTYGDLKKTVKDFVAGRAVFFSSSSSGPSQASAKDVAPKTVLKRPDALERKVDALTDQLAQLSLLVKKNQATSGGSPSSAGRVCSYCKRTGHGANKCDINPHRDTRCQRCQNFGHSESTCWIKITPEMTRKVGFQGVRSESDTEKRLSSADSQDRSDQVTVITESAEDEVVAAAKRNAAGQALPKQARTDTGVPIPSLLNPSPLSVPMEVMPKPRTRVRKMKPKRKIKSRKPGIPEHVGKYSVLEELARAPSGLTFGQLIRGDADEAKVEIRKALSKGARPGRAVIAHIGDGVHRRRLKVVPVKVYGTTTQALLDSGAVPNLMSSTLAVSLSLSPSPTTKRITVADGSNAVVRGFLTGIPVSFGSIPVPLDFLVVDGTPVDIIIGCPALEMLQARLDMGEQHVTITIGDRSVQLGLEHDHARFRAFENITDSEEFTSEEEEESSESDSDEENLVVAVLEQEPYEPNMDFGHKDDEDDDDLPPLLEVEPESEDEEDDEGPVVYVEHPEAARRSASLFEKVSHLPPAVQQELVEKLEDLGIVAWTLDDLRPADVPVQHEFELKDDTPIHSSARRLPPRHIEVVRDEVDKMLRAGIITPSVSAWSFPVVIATKKDGKPRFCVDYRSLNRRMKADRWPLPKTEEIFDDLEGSNCFTTLDLFSGYWQVRMAEQCKEKTTFVCRFGTFQFEVMPFGLMNAPSTFQRMMYFIFRGLRFVRCYLDDVVVYSSSIEEHISHLVQVFDIIASHGLKLKISKCSFVHSRVKLLGHVVDERGVAVDNDKIEAIRTAPIPASTTELRSFLGLAGYYRRFIKGFAETSAVLHEATSSKKDFQWTEEMRVAFDTLKTKLTSPPVLAFPDFGAAFVVETDASSVAVGAVLAQRKEDGKVHPIQYASRTMTAAEKNYSACEREALGVIFALKKFRVYLLSSVPFKLVTDHQALRYAFQKKDVHGRLARWLDFLAEYEYEIVYRTGSSNNAADYLSRIEWPTNDAPIQDYHDEGDLCSTVLMEECQSVLADVEPHLQDTARYLLGQAIIEADERRRRSIKRNAKNFLVWNGKMFRRVKRGLRSIVPIGKRVGVLRTFHDDIGHWDIEATKHFITTRYWWPTIHRDIYDYVKTCEGCQYATPLPKYRTDLSVPITSLFDTFSIDFAGPLPISKNGNRFGLIAVEHLTGWPLAQATERSTGDVVIDFVTREIIHPFGPPRLIISDNANCFTAAGVEAFMKGLGIKWKTVLAYAPMSNGRAERMVGTIKRAIKKMVIAGRCDWEEALPQVLFGYRRRRMAHGASPFEMMYGVGARFSNDEQVALVPESSPIHRQLELLSASRFRAERALRSNGLERSMPSPKFSVGQEVLVARGPALGTTVKWPPFTSKYTGPYRIITASHPRYRLVSSTGRVSRRPVHARRLVLYKRRPTHLQERD